MAVNQRLGAILALVARRWGVGPSTISLAALATGALTSGLVFLLIEYSTTLVAALVGFIGWQLAYSLDCADGQLARATGTSSAEGAVLDLLTDFVVQVLVVAVATHFAFSSAASNLAIPAGVLLSGGWLISPYYGGILSVFSPESRRQAASRWRSAIAHTRDYGLHIALLPVAMLVGPLAVRALLIAITILNLGALILGVWKFASVGTPRNQR